jgi:aminoglycoside phosphotransferase (APT) family kinase protein
MPGVHKAGITVELAARLVAAQFPQWAGLPVRAVAADGWDNSTFRLGQDMLVRLPSDDAYVLQVAKEQRWLPVLAPLLPLPIPVPLAQGAPGLGFGRPWSVYRWLDGETAEAAPPDDLERFAADLARFLVALQRIDPAGGPLAGEHSFHRGGSLTVYDGQVRQALADLHGVIDTESAGQVWRAALDAASAGSRVWVHGDVAIGNLLVRDGRLSGVIDFGCCAVGDPACDTVIAWTLFTGPSRERFRAGLRLDEATWARGRGWALWKAMIVLAGALHDDPQDAIATGRVIEEILADHRAARTGST